MAEPSGIAVRRILGVGAVLALGVILTVIAVILVLQQRLEPARARNAHQGQIPPAPRLQAYPPGDLTALRAQKETLLEGWGWTDDTRQFAHIPIEQAVADYVRQHEAAKPAADTATGRSPERAQ